MLVALDVDEPEGKALRESYNVQAFPTFMMIDTSGEIIDAWIGYGGPESWIESLDLARGDMTTVAQKKARYARKPDLATAKALARNADAAGESKAAVTYYDDLLEMDEANRSEYIMNRFDAISGGYRHEIFTADETAAAADAVIAEEGCGDTDRMLVAYYMGRVAKGESDPSYYLPYLKAAMNLQDPSIEDGYQGLYDLLEIDFALKVEKDNKKATKLKKAGFEEGWRDRPEDLNDYAWWCFENNLNLKEAQKMAERAVEKTEDARGKANILDTLAEICHARGRTDDALDHIRRAIELNPDSDYLKGQLEKFSKS